MFAAQTRVIFNPRLKCFYDTLERKRLKGAAKLLAKTFWPTYSFRRAPPTPRHSGAPATHGVSARQGRARGSRVDREVAAVARGERLRSPHPFTLYALEALRRCALSVVGAQVVVYEGAVATAVDILATDASGMYTCIELKCSSDSRYTSACGPMRGVLSGRTDALSEQHAVQCQVQLTSEATELAHSRTRARRSRGCCSNARTASTPTPASCASTRRGPP
jgi:hypothetical protein